LFVAPSFMSGSDSYEQRLRMAGAMLWGWVLLAVLVGIACGWACRRRERDVFGNTSWLWPVLVGLCGWFGWMAYICLRPLPARLPHGQWMPSQPDPGRPLGTEVFA